MVSLALSGVQKHFCTISGSRDISKSKWDIGQSFVSESDVFYYSIFILAHLFCTEMGLKLKHAKGRDL